MSPFEQIIFSEFDGSNYMELANKYNTPIRKVYRIIRLAAQGAMREVLQASVGTHLEILWCDQMERSGSLRSCVELLQAAQTAPNSCRPDLSGIALVALPIIHPAVPVDSTGDATSVAAVESQPGIPNQTSPYRAAPPLSPFSYLFARTVGLLGIKPSKCADVCAFESPNVNANTQAPARPDYGLPPAAPNFGGGYVQPPKESTTHPLPNVLVRASALANASQGARLLIVAHQLDRTARELHTHAKQLEQLRLLVRAEIRSLNTGDSITS